MIVNFFFLNGTLYIFLQFYIDNYFLNTMMYDIINFNHRRASKILRNPQKLLHNTKKNFEKNQKSPQNQQ